MDDDKAIDQGQQKSPKPTVTPRKVLLKAAPIKNAHAKPIIAAAVKPSPVNAMGKIQYVPYPGQQSNAAPHTDAEEEDTPTAEPVAETSDRPNDEVDTPDTLSTELTDNEDRESPKAEKLKSRNVCVFLSLIPIAGIPRMYLGYWKIGIIQFILSLGIPIIAILLMAVGTVVIDKVFGYDMLPDDTDEQSPLFIFMMILPYVGWFWCYIESHVIKTDAKGRNLRPGSFWQRVGYIIFGFVCLIILIVIPMIGWLGVGIIMRANEPSHSTSLANIIIPLSFFVVILLSSIGSIIGLIGLVRSSNKKFYLHNTIKDILLSIPLVILHWMSFAAAIHAGINLSERGYDTASNIALVVGIVFWAISLWLIGSRVKKCNENLTKWELVQATSARVFIIFLIQFMSLLALASILNLTKKQKEVGSSAKLRLQDFLDEKSNLLRTWGTIGRKLLPFIILSTICITLTKKACQLIGTTSRERDIDLVHPLGYGVLNLLAVVVGVGGVLALGNFTQELPKITKTPNVQHIETSPTQYTTEEDFDFTPEDEEVATAPEPQPTPQPEQQEEPEVTPAPEPVKVDTPEPSSEADAVRQTPTSAESVSDKQGRGNAAKMMGLMNRAFEIIQSGAETLAEVHAHGQNASCTEEETHLLMDIIANPAVNDESGQPLFGLDSRPTAQLACYFAGLAAEESETSCGIVFKRLEKEAAAMDPSIFRCLMQSIARTRIKDINYRLCALASAMIKQGAGEAFANRAEILAYIWEAIGAQMSPAYVDYLVERLLETDSALPPSEALKAKQQAIVEFAHLLSPVHFLKSRVVQKPTGGYFQIEKETEEEITVSAMVEVSFAPDMQNYRAITGTLNQIFSKEATVIKRFARSMTEIEDDTEGEQMCRAEGNIDKSHYPQVCTINIDDMLEEMPADIPLIFISSADGKETLGYAIREQSSVHVLFDLIKQMCGERGIFPFNITIALRDKDAQPISFISHENKAGDNQGQPMYSNFFSKVTEKEALLIDPSFYGGTAVLYGIGGEMFFGKRIMKITGSFSARDKNRLDMLTYYSVAPSFMLSEQETRKFAERLIHAQTNQATPAPTAAPAQAPKSMMGKRLRFIYSDTRYREGEYDGETCLWGSWRKGDISKAAVWVGQVAPQELIFTSDNQAIAKAARQEVGYKLVCSYQSGGADSAIMYRQLTFDLNEPGEESGEYVLSFETPTSGTAILRNCYGGENCFECENIKFVIEEMSEEELNLDSEDTSEGGLSKAEKAELQDFLETLIMTPARASSTWKLYQTRLMTLLPMIQEGSPVDVTTVDTKGNTALHYACGMGRVDIVEWLVNHGADVNKRTDKGATPLDCVSGGYNAAEIRRILIQHGATKGKKGRR